MSATWQFYEQTATDPIHNPIAGEFFSTEAVGNVAEALVREGIQNSLDARIRDHEGSPPKQPARVRIFVSETVGGLTPEKAQRWFGSLWPHVTAPGNGLRGQPTSGDVCPFLVFEDFGTTGLNGDPEAHAVESGIRNHFLNFFRAEGHSDKGENDRGSWGVGKTVFPRASRISSFIGLTVRSADNRRLLLGRSILKYHRVGAKNFKSDGYLGVARSDGFVLPVDSEAEIAAFTTDFSLLRKGESGLSIVVPWYEINGDDGITGDSVISAVLRGFFYPIQMGHLAVTVETPSQSIELNQDSIESALERIGGKLCAEMLPLVRLAEWARTRLPREHSPVKSPSETGAQRWADEMVPEDLVKEIRASLAERRPIAIRVPMTVQTKQSNLLRTHFNVYLEYSEQDNSRPVFIRDELVITDVKPPRVNQVRALVIVDDRPIANLLRDAETPAHTQWNPDTGNFKNKYKFGPGAIQFVRVSVSELLRIVHQAEATPDPTITIDYFSVPATEEDDDAIPAHKRRPKKKDGDNVPPVPDLPSPPLKRFRIVKTAGGFGIRAGDQGAPVPARILVRVAYDVRRGNALKKYDKADFNLGSKAIQIAPHGDSVTILEAESNRLLVGINKSGFGVDVSGFDELRDLYVRAEAQGGADVDQAN